MMSKGMTVAAVVEGAGVLDQISIRTNLLRIPVVIARLKQAQQVLDRRGRQQVDLLSMMTLDEFAFSESRLRQLLSDIVQVGLFDRFSKKRPQDFLLLVGPRGSALLLKVLA